MKVGIVKETFPGERRVALTPASMPQMTKAGADVLIQAGAGVEAGYTDDMYRERGATVVDDRVAVLSECDALLQVRSLGANPVAGREDVQHFRPGQIIIGTSEPLTSMDATKQLVDAKVSMFSLEMVPRITRAQSMDVLSSMATIAGYRAVLLAATTLPRIFPMLMTAAGTVTAAKVFIIGAGVAGLQAIATARRLGGVVKSYDVRPAVREQVESLGGKFVEMELETVDTETKGGYAKAQDEEFYRRQRELMAKVVAESDVVITTAAIPGKKSPVLITTDAARGMAPGSVIVDLAAERGGNCELTQADQTVVDSGVTILGPTNLPSEIPYHASQMFSKNITTFFLHLLKDGQADLDADDEIIRETLVCQDGKVTHERIQGLMESEGNNS